MPEIAEGRPYCLQGSIEVGQQFTWEPYKISGSNRATEFVRVTKIVAWGEEMPFTDAEDDKPEAETQIECEDRRGKRQWNDIGRFREACVQGWS